MRQNAQLVWMAINPSRHAGARCGRAGERRRHGIQERQGQGDAGAAEETAAGKDMRSNKTVRSSAISTRESWVRLFRQEQRALHDLVDKERNSKAIGSRPVQNLVDGGAVGETRPGRRWHRRQLLDHVPRDGTGIGEQELFELVDILEWAAVGHLAGASTFGPHL